ncbi:hypothetical protein ACFVUS_02880 [Nocardia sp. NPDC058058]|uniref:hypothetical protein n=1 Tax=Nocardia sp. NPDC058058 TaxID=3346317 RepID=UPI0036DEFD47
MNILWSEDATAVITPSARHFAGGEVADVLAVADVIYLDSAVRYKKHRTGIIAVALYAPTEVGWHR